MAIAHVASNSAKASSASSVGVGLTGVTSGNQITALGRTYNNATNTFTSITCTSESNLTLIGSIQRGFDDYAFQIGYLSNVTVSENKTVTLTSSASVSGIGITASEWSGGDTTTFYDGGEIGATGTTSPATGNLTTSTDAAMIVGLGACAGFGWDSADAAWTAADLSAIDWFEMWQYDVDVGTAGSKTFSRNTVIDTDWIIKAAAFKPAGGGGGGGAVIPVFRRHYQRIKAV